MTKSSGANGPTWDDDDIPELTDEELAGAEFSIGNVVIRYARDAEGNPRPRLNPLPPGRPPERDMPKRQVTLRLDGDVIDRFRADGPGWQSRINAALRGAAGL